MRQDPVEAQRREAARIQVSAELQRLDADARKDEARRRLDDELGLSRKRSEFRRRLDELRTESKGDFDDLMSQYRSDWESFKLDATRRLKAGEPARDATLDLIEARVDGLRARLKFLAGAALGQDAKEADALNDVFERVEKSFRDIRDRAADALARNDADLDRHLSACDKELQDVMAGTERELLAKKVKAGESLH